MSKRYREVLEDVQTHRSRAAQAGTDVGADADVVDEVAGTSVAGASVASVGVVGAAGEVPAASGGVATLVRAPAPVVPVAPAGMADDVAGGRTRPGASPVRRSARPGNGPVDADQPVGFAWRGRRYDVTRILGHWREEEGWWRRPDGEPIRIEQSDLWRVEAVRGGGMARDQRGVYELSRRGAAWRLDRVWD